MSEKKYIHKRNQIASIIIGIECEFESWRNGIYTVANPTESQAREAAENILAKMGINKPKDFHK